MVVRTEASQLYLLRVLDLFRVAIAPFNGHFGVGIGVNENVEGAVSIKHGKECDGCCDLAENSLYLILDLLLRLLDRSLFGVRAISAN